MRSFEYRRIVYENGIYDINSTIRHKIHKSTMDCLKRKNRSFPKTQISKTELIIKLSLVISIISLIVILSM